MRLFAVILFALFTSTLLTAQVGINTDVPSAELDIVTTNTGIPALELNPQSAPVGNQTGQLAVIGDKLFLYDATRGKWLSVESTPLQFGRNGDVDNERLRFGGDVRDNSSGAKMPLNGTIVYVAVQTAGGVADKEFDIKINGTDVGDSVDPTLDGRFELVGGSFSYSDYNINFDAGDFISLEVRNPGGDVEDPAAIIWVKWRQ
ncbi:MAG: hypothetical protein ABJM06_11490 [Gilvibacter sp.]